jgi:hypothetical protein
LLLDAGHHEAPECSFSSGVEALLRHRETLLRWTVEVGEAVNKLRRHTPRRPSVTSFEHFALFHKLATWPIPLQ